MRRFFCSTIHNRTRRTFLGLLLSLFPPSPFWCVLPSVSKQRKTNFSTCRTSKCEECNFRFFRNFCTGFFSFAPASIRYPCSIITTALPKDKYLPVLFSYSMQNRITSSILFLGFLDFSPYVFVNCSKNVFFDAHGYKYRSFK